MSDLTHPTASASADHYLRTYPCAGPTLADHPALVIALAHVKAASATANLAAGAITASVAEAITAAADQLATDPSVVAATPVLMGGGAVAVNVAVNEAISTATCGAATPAEVNRSQSTADVVHTGGRLAVLAALDALSPTLDALVDALRDAGARWEAEAPTTLARTCLQDALAVPTSTWSGGAAATVRRHRLALATAGEPLTLVTLGSTVVGLGTGTPAGHRGRVVAALARRVGRPLEPHPDPASALQHGDDLLAVSHAMAATATTLLRVARDLRLLVSGPDGGLGELRLPATADGSSFFGGKTNPIDPESAVQLCCAALGLHAADQALALHGELHLDVFALPVAVDVLAAAHLVGSAAAALTRTVRSVTVETARCAELSTLGTGRPKEMSP